MSLAISSEDLKSALERTLGEGGQSRIASLTRVASAHAACSALEELDVVFHDARQLRVIFKDLSHNMWPEGDIEDPDWDPAREIRIYEQVLAGMDLGTPRFYGGVSGDPGRCWLFVEEVEGRKLAEVDDFSAWRSATRWLAAMHSRMQTLLPQVQRAVSLPVHDELYFRCLVTRTLAHMKRVRGAQDTLVAHFETLAGDCQRALTELSNLSRTVIHGDFHSKNILVSSQAGGSRICVIDWEKVAEAPGLLDLATLISKTRSADDRQVLAALYYDEVKRVAPDYLERDQFLRLLGLGRVWVYLRRMTSHERWLTKTSWLTAALQEIQELCGASQPLEIALGNSSSSSTPFPGIGGA